MPGPLRIGAGRLRRHSGGAGHLQKPAESCRSCRCGQCRCCQRGRQSRRGGGCRAESDCVLPGENGTVFIGGHTGTYFSDLGSTQLGAIIHLETDWGDFTYKVTDMQVIQETDVDKVRWGAEEPSCILYTCYPFGILTHTPQRYAVYADPVSADEYGVVPSETTEK